MSDQEAADLVPDSSDKPSAVSRTYLFTAGVLAVAGSFLLSLFADPSAGSYLWDIGISVLYLLLAAGVFLEVVFGPVSPKLSRFQLYLSSWAIAALLTGIVSRHWGNPKALILSVVVLGVVTAGSLWAGSKLFPTDKANTDD